MNVMSRRKASLSPPFFLLRACSCIQVICEWQDWLNVMMIMIIITITITCYGDSMVVYFSSQTHKLILFEKCECIILVQVLSLSLDPFLSLQCWRLRHFRHLTRKAGTRNAVKRRKMEECERKPDYYSSLHLDFSQVVVHLSMWWILQVAPSHHVARKMRWLGVCLFSRFFLSILLSHSCLSRSGSIHAASSSSFVTG